MRLLAATGGGRPIKEVWRNWSNNHVSQPMWVYRPQTQSELEFIIQLHNARKEPLTCVGAGLSPNGLAFGVRHAISLANMDQVVYIDAERKQAKFQCGITIQEVVDALKPHGLMLPNLASINLQQLGGFYSVGAHGTGKSLPPVEEQILSLTLATPTGEVMELDRNHKWFRFAQLSLGLLGVVIDVTVQLVDVYKMKQTKQVFTVDALTKHQFKDLVMGNDHVKFMWYPHENKTVACYSNRTDDKVTTTHRGDDGLKEMRDLYAKMHAGKQTTETSFADLRALLLQGKSLDLDAVKQINNAEVKFHENTQGSEVAEADKFMAFDCGGSQLVYEFCMRFDPETCRDYDLVRALLERIQSEGLPAPGPIEHRFTSGSGASMSPAHGASDEVFSWIGIVMYIPHGEDDDVEEIKSMFSRYCEVTKAVAADMQAEIRVHWAKLEIPHDKEKLQQELRALYPVDEFNALRRELDPNHVFQTEWSLAMFGKH